MVVNNMKNFLKKKNIKVVSMNVNAVKMKNKGQLNTKKKLYNEKKIKVTQHFFYNHSQNI